MALIYFWIFVGLLVVGLGYAVSRPARAYKFPALMTLAFGSFILPQAISLIRFPEGVPSVYVDKVMLMTCLCLAAGLFGYRLRPNRTLIRRMRWQVDWNRLFHAGLALTSISAVFGYLLGRIDVDYADTGGMTGIGTILMFFQQLCYPGFAICAFCTARRPTLGHFAASLLGMIPLLRAVAEGRREGIALFVLIVGLAIYFQRRWMPPRWALPLGVVIATLIIPAAGTYRRLSKEWGRNAVRQIEFVDNFKRFVTEPAQVLELRNAAATISATDLTGDHQYGSAYWNHLVFRFVPAQIVGKDFKDAISIGEASDFKEKKILANGYEAVPGSTITGMGDSYQQFGYFGCIFFVGMAVIFKTLWRVSHSSNALFPQLLYVLSCTSAMRAVTHWTQDFLPGILYYLIFLTMAMLYARRRDPQGSRRHRRSPRVTTLDVADYTKTELSPHNRTDVHCAPNRYRT